MVSPIAISNEVRAVLDIKRIIAESGEDDDQLIHDMIEGETSFLEIIEALLGARQDAEAMQSAIKERMKALKERADRYAAKSERLKTVIFDAMRLADTRKLELPEATLSIGAARQSVQVIDEDLLPPDCVKITRTPDKTEIGKRLKDGQDVQGALLSNGGETLTIRIK